MWLLLIPDGINGCNVAKCSLFILQVYSLGLYTDKHNLFLTVSLTANDIDHSFDYNYVRTERKSVCHNGLAVITW